MGATGETTPGGSRRAGADGAVMEALRERQYRKRPIVIAAVQWTGTNADEVLAFTMTRASVRDESMRRRGSSERVLVIETLEGSMRAEPGDWIICGIKGEFCPCKPDIFAATYEPVTPEPEARPLEAARPPEPGAAPAGAPTGVELREAMWLAGVEAARQAITDRLAGTSHRTGRAWDGLNEAVVAVGLLKAQGMSNAVGRGPAQSREAPEAAISQARAAESRSEDGDAPRDSGAASTAGDDHGMVRHRAGSVGQAAPENAVAPERSEAAE